MLKTTDNTNKREFSRAEGSMREKLRAKIRQRLHNMPSEGDENVNTLNQDNSTRTRRKSEKTVPPRGERVSFSNLLYIFFFYFVYFFNKTYV